MRTARARVGSEAEAIVSYNALLRAELELAHRSFGGLVEAQRVHRLMMPGRLLCSVLRPRFISASRVARLAQVSAVLAGLLERLGKQLMVSDALLDLIGASEEERSLWAIDPGYPGFTLSSRLDSFMVGDEPRFVEYNAESPAGIGFTDRLTDIFRELSVMQRWEKAGALHGFEGRRHLLETLLWAYRTYGGRDTPSIAIVDWEHVITRRDFELCGSFFQQQGMPVVITDPRRFEYRRGRLYHQGQEITLIYRRVLLHELLEKAGEAQALLRAYREGAVCMVNSPRSKLLHKKAVLALLSDWRRLELDLNDEEQAVVDATVPWTRLLAPGETTYGGKTVDLLRFVLAEQHHLVLKPVDDYGGRGVVLGWETSREGWEQALETALPGGDSRASKYVVQERVPVPLEEFPTWEGERVEIVPLLVDTDPLLFRGQMGSIVTRISGSALLNVSAGAGSTTPTLVLESEES